jgi:hypothetical protein
MADALIEAREQRNALKTQLAATRDALDTVMKALAAHRKIVDRVTITLAQEDA